MNEHGERCSPHRDEPYQTASSEVRAQPFSHAGGLLAAAHERAVLEEDEVGPGGRLASFETTWGEQRRGEALVGGILQLDRAERGAGGERGGKDADPAAFGVVHRE